MVGGGKDREEMSDLISRSEMIRAIEEHYINLTNDNVPRSIPDFYSEMQKMVYNQPTAFDMEKVVEQLEEKIEITWEHDYRGGRKDAFNEAIDIVKKGGVE